MSPAKGKPRALLLSSWSGEGGLRCDANDDDAGYHSEFFFNFFFNSCNIAGSLSGHLLLKVDFNQSAAPAFFYTKMCLYTFF